MKRFKHTTLVILWMYTWLCVIKGQCEKGTETFLISNDNIVKGVKPFYASTKLNLEQCVEACRRQFHCRSVGFQANDTGYSCSFYSISIDNIYFQEDITWRSEQSSFYAQKMCLQATCKRLFSLEMVVGGEMDDSSQIVIHNSSIEGCLNTCLLHKNVTCRSVVFDVHTQTCKLSQYDRYSRSTKFKKTDRNVLYFNNDCEVQPAFSGTSAEVILLGNAQHSFILSEYDGKSVGECGQLCFSSVKFPCRSFLYGTKNGSAYCALSNQNRIGLLKDGNGFRPTQSLNYYEISQKWDVCEKEDIHFELRSGTYLDDVAYKVIVTATDKIQESTLFKTGVKTIKVDSNYTVLTGDGVYQENCIKLCRKDEKCYGVSIDHAESKCSFHEFRIRSTTADKLKLMDTSYYFEKICLQTDFPCTQMWAFEQFHKHKLTSSGGKLLTSVFTKEECLASCLEHKEFQCQSADYDQRLSECKLFSFSRFTVNDKSSKIQLAEDSVYHYENNCYREPRGFCNSKTHKWVHFGYPDKIVDAKRSSECKLRCYQEIGFNCHSYWFNSATQKCHLSHHNSLTVPPKAIQADKQIDTHEIMTCYDVSVTCEPHMMKVNVRTNAMFNGKIYVKRKPATCYMDITRSTNFTFPISLSGSDCETENEGEGKFSTVIVIQNNDLVLTSTDKAVGVHCTYELGNKTEYAILSIKNLTSSVTSRGRAIPPKMTMRILDLKGNDKTSVKLGEQLRVQVSVPQESPYGIFVRNMIATDATGTSNLTLIDSKGCPAEAKMIREMRRIDGQSRALESIMEAFAFTGSNVLRIETDVETCIDSCTPVICQLPSGRSEDQYLAVESLGRRRREASESQVTRLAKTIAIHSEKFGVGTFSKVGRQVMAQNNDAEMDDEDEFQYIQDTVPTNDSICLDSLILTIGGCAFALLQVILLTICCTTRYYRNQKKIIEKLKRCQHSQMNSDVSSSSDGYESLYQFIGLNSETVP